MINVCCEDRTKHKLCVQEAEFLNVESDFYNQQHKAASLIS